MSTSRRKFLALLGLAPAAPLLAKLPAPAASERVEFDTALAPIDPLRHRYLYGAWADEGIDPLAPLAPWKPLRREYVWSGAELERNPYDHDADLYGYLTAWRRP